MRPTTHLYLWLNRRLGAPAPGPKEAVRAYHHEKTGDTSAIPRMFFPKDSMVLVVGCDENAAEVNAVARRCQHVFGIDINKRVVKEARAKADANATILEAGLGRLPFEDASFDVIYMKDVCEHLIAADQCFAEYRRVLRPSGRIYNSFAPLFYSAFGAHLAYALRLPWGHLLFGVRSVVELRNLYYPGESEATNWAECGLNRLTLARYQTLLKTHGLKSIMRTVHVSARLPVVGAIPGLRNLFIQGIEDVLEVL